MYKQWGSIQPLNKVCIVMYISTCIVINFVSCMQIKIHEAPTELREDQDGHYNMEKDDWADDDTGPLLEVFYNICCSFACSFQ